MNDSIMYNYKRIIKKVYDFRNSKEVMNVTDVSPEKTYAYQQSYKPGNHLNQTGLHKMLSTAQTIHITSTYF